MKKIFLVLTMLLFAVQAQAFPPTSNPTTVNGMTGGTISSDTAVTGTISSTGVVSQNGSDAASVAATGALKRFAYNKTLAADGNDACGGTVDCITLPIPTTTGFLQMWYGTVSLSAVVAADGTATAITDSGAGIEYQAAIGACTELCLHDGGTNTIIFNDTASSVTVNLIFDYD